MSAINRVHVLIAPYSALSCSVILVNNTTYMCQTWESTWEVDLRSTWTFQVGSSHLCLPSSRFCLAPFVSCEVDFTTKNVCHVPV